MDEVPPATGSMTIEEYLEREKDSPVRREYIGGQLRVKTGTTRRHNLIALNILGVLWQATRGTSCHAYVSNLKVRTPDDRFYYPDIMVSCEPESGDEYTETSPCLIAEVVSPETDTIDRHEKLLAYRTVPSMRAYLIVEQDTQHVERHTRRNDGTWTRTDQISDSVFAIPCPEIQFSVTDIYRDL